MKKRYVLVVIIFISFTGWILVKQVAFEYAFIPSEDKIINSTNFNVQSTHSPDKEQIELGKELYFKETFGNEVFFTDILGMVDGPFTIGNIAKAILRLGGEGTSNLQVEAAEDFSASHVNIKKGDLIDTGLDVAKGSLTPLGVKISVDEGRPKIGISCAVCHATVDHKGNVIAGVTNTDLNIGLALAMGTNTASYFTHTEMESLKEYFQHNATSEISVDGEKKTIPKAEEFEQFVDSEIIQWPIGSNDTTIEFMNNPVQIPDTFTQGDQPYGWSGQGQIGPFHGLSAAINNAHSQNMDAISQSAISEKVLQINKEVYFATLLQNAANPKFKYDISSEVKPSDFFKGVDPTPGVPGVNELIYSASFPKINYLTSISLLSSSPGFKSWEQINAMSAYMNTLQVPKTGLETSKEKMDEGKRIFANAGCISCHGGQHFTNNKVIKSEEIKTNPSRAKGFGPSERLFTNKPKTYSFVTPVPLPKDPKLIEYDISDEQKEQLDLAWAHNTNGGYKTISLLGLYWSAPYLHDGGVAVGPNGEMGVTETLFAGIKPDPTLSMKAMLDSSLREEVVRANKNSTILKTAEITGEGHEFWVDDTTGFSEEEQEALIYYLLRLGD
ncbi:hypothetical protein [Litchfieldia alkalitelluris]|uniref:hypothetical protein n=1 Tax=Litchfieldia alkalitelluris TaxID=304268 RepID=UPI0009979F12|nr:hypothetical protein [Litchfieldia alkalitelluris]